MSKKTDFKKIVKLSYVFILSCITYFLLVGSLYKNNSVPDWTHEILTKRLTNEWYMKCPNNRKSLDCVGRYKQITIDGVTIDANKWTPETSQLRKSWNKNRKNNEYKWIYDNDRMLASQRATDLNQKVIWVIFLITLPIIWFSRQLSVPIVNSIMKIINKGWKKI